MGSEMQYFGQAPRVDDTLRNDEGEIRTFARDTEEIPYQPVSGVSCNVATACSLHWLVTELESRHLLGASEEWIAAPKVEMTGNKGQASSPSPGMFAGPQVCHSRSRSRAKRVKQRHGLASC
jgi:hypothetical protein